MKCKIKLLSPLHIGNGNELKMIDFYLNSNHDNIKFIDFDKFINYCIRQNIDFEDKIHESQYQTGKDFSITKFINKNGIDTSEITSYTASAIIEKRERESEFTVKEHIKSSGPYIPGSSIKGSIRTALMWYYLNESEENRQILFSTFDSWVNGDTRKPRPKFADDEISKQIFGNSPQKDILKSLKISDTNQLKLNNLEVSETKIIGNSEQIPVYVENLKSEAELAFDLYIDNYFFNENVNIFNDNLKSYMDTNTVFKACNDFSRNVVEKHLSYNWESYGCYDTPGEFERIHDEILNCGENEAVIHVGWGGGWYNTTVGMLTEQYSMFDDLRRMYNLGRKPNSNRFSQTYPKTRNVRIDGMPLGWVKLQLLD